MLLRYAHYTSSTHLYRSTYKCITSNYYCCIDIDTKCVFVHEEKPRSAPAPATLPALSLLKRAGARGRRQHGPECRWFRVVLHVSRGRFNQQQLPAKSWQAATGLLGQAGPCRPLGLFAVGSAGKCAYVRAADGVG